MTTGAHIEIVASNAKSGDAPLMPDAVLINGVDVGLVAKDSLRIEPGDSDNITAVTLTIYPARLTIRGAEESE